MAFTLKGRKQEETREFRVKVPVTIAGWIEGSGKELGLEPGDVLVQMIEFAYKAASKTKPEGAAKGARGRKAKAE